ncbi:TPA: TonB-dependent hemoglobin/transferrin/lactoferrin family receptor [Neisseria meningitidis]|uniref:TonB-dependent hemoglobin/transferrin/lactoferrin family receptor n=1 Tax=Neisseria meningitidis TaxID=487 RepID=UPI000E569888|nr:TonB-dependent hemoglobin/transferrin/lactoferrin family receptor [Neisseria meningitidis]MBG8590957.1 TonB-dependent hemoglobin/transferrin/lactoferrin family receptor [Neisseria meningitidis]MBG8606905.1 TonB-dependent hemoglobin/transferrin/lactoferrin family receptor [Neisseria meningitidis]MBG8755776.1 TonB-dependent hemoglobin/transferrin/lactoferrin family receptor [Neisseria meningitidis]MBJ1797338.1 TonB-dependent hemoglobin/transferrin/lactoferrin family receptor [Neisseria meningi
MKPLQMLPIAALVGSIFGNPVLAADEAATETTPVKAEVKAVRVKGQRNAPAAVERVNLGRIQQEMIRDNKDLVRYSTDVGLSDSGRHQKGFAIRGVEGNRVGVSIDGVNLPDSEENSLYARYGNFNSSRLSIDPELVRNIEIVKGADSFNTGSGALGGGVNYQTLQGRDLLLDDRQFGVMMKNGYSTRNREWTNTLGFGVSNDRVDAALLYSQRRGHETESAGNRGYPVEGAGKETNIRGSARGIPDPSKHKYHNFLGKIAYQINDNHRIGASLNGQQGHNYTVEESYNLTASSWREADDVNRRRNANLFYEWMPDSNWLSSLKADFDYQKTKVAAINYKGLFPTNYTTWETEYHKKEVGEIYNRSMDTRFKRFTLRLDSHPLQLGGGRHRLSFKTFASRRDFENLNRDDYYFSGQISRTTSSIQHPVKTTNYGFSLSDQIQWNDVFSSRAGIRYDHTKMTPQELNAECHACDKTPPAANTYKGWSGFVGLAAQLNQAWRVGYDITAGYRVPNASEIYFTYDNGAATWLANPSLKAERSTTHTLSLQGRGEKGTLDANLYQSNYHNFLSEEQFTRLIRDEKCDEDYALAGYCKLYRNQLYWHMENIDKARIRGIELTGRLNVDKVASFVPEGWKLFGSLGYAKSKLSGDNSLLSTQPLKVIAGIDYESPSEKWGVFSRLTYLGAKKAKDAQYTEYEGYRFIKKVKDYPWLNKSAYVFDMYGFYKPAKNLTLRAGVYNMFNRKYTTWDSLRGLYSYSTTNSVDRDGKGLDRYRAPSRNYAVSLEWKF